MVEPFGSQLVLGDPLNVVDEVRGEVDGRLARTQPHRRRGRLRKRFFRNHVQISHPAQDAVAAGPGCVCVAKQEIAIRRLDDAGQKRRLGQRQIGRAFGEIGVRCVLDAVNAFDARLSQVNFVEVHLQNLLFGVAQLQRQRELRFVELARDGFSRREKEVFGHLLRDGGAALRKAAFPEIDSQRAADGEDIDARMGIKALVLAGDDRVLQVRRDGFERHLVAGLELRIEQAADFLRFQTHGLLRLAVDGAGDYPAVHKGDFHRGRLFFTVPMPRNNSDMSLVARVSSGRGRFSGNAAVSQAVQAVAQAQIVRGIARADLQRPSVENRRPAAVAAGDAPAHLDIAKAQAQA